MNIKPELNEIISKMVSKGRISQSKNLFNLIKLKKEVDKLETVEYKNLKNIKFIGAATYKEIKKQLKNKADEVLLNEISFSVEEIKLTKNKTQSKIQRKQKEYIPQFQSAAYGIMAVLYKSESMTKNQIFSNVGKYSKVEFSNNVRFSGWSAMNGLIKKNLAVCVTVKPKTYSLTSEGKVLAGKMFETEDLKSSSFINQEGEIKLIIDSREIKSKKETSFFQTELKDLTTETRNLEVGDFVWILKEKNEEYLLDFIIERKAGKDFISSIFDKRLNNQKQRLLKSNIKNVIYLIEGLTPALKSKHETSVIEKNLIDLKTSNVCVIETENIGETIEFIKKIDEMVKNSQYEASKLNSFDNLELDCKKELNFEPRGLFKTILTSIKGVKNDSAELILKEIPTIKKLLELHKENTLRLQLKALKFSDNISSQIIKRFVQ